MKSHTEVAIVGGGVVGAAILWHLAKAGITNCTLLEKSELTAGSTWHAAGNIPTYANSWLGMRAGNYAWRIYSELEKDPQAPITYRHTGAIWPAHTPERMQLFQHLCGVSRAAGFELSMISAQDIEARHPFWKADDTVLGGILDPYEGDIDPSQLTQALAHHARALGASVVRQCRVQELSQRASGEWDIETSKGSIVAGTVINAAGSSGGHVASLAGLYAPVATLEHQYMVTDSIPELDENTEVFPLIRDPELRFYLRRERNAFLLGSYAHDGRAVWRDGVPHDFDHALFEDDIDGMLGVVEAAVSHVPLLEKAGARRFVNGPIPYAPDALPLVGPAAGVRNFYHATGVQIGITHSAAIGKAMVEWLTEGETEWDLSSWDPRRFGDWATPAYANVRAAEHYSLQYAIPFPHRLMQSGRPLNQTPLYSQLKARGAVMGQVGGWERAFWFQTNNHKDTGELSFDDEPWHDAVADECRAVRDGVGVMDHGGFTKYVVEGSGAVEYLLRMFCGSVPKPGRIKLSYLLTPKGHIWSEATITCLEENRFLLCGPTVAIERDFDWLQAGLPEHSVKLSKGYERDGALLLMGARSRDVLTTLTDHDIGASAMPWMSVAEIVVAGVSVTAMRVSYVGELGWELHCASEDVVALYDALIEAGASLGIRDFGSYALNSMRIEKGYHAWGADIGSEYSLYDAGLEHFISGNNKDFVGYGAVSTQSEVASQWEFVALEIPGEGPDTLGSDPILIDNRVVGYVTSSARGFRTNKRLALGYIERGTVPMGGVCQVQSFDEMRQAQRHEPDVYDPKNERLRG